MNDIIAKYILDKVNLMLVQKQDFYYEFFFIYFQENIMETGNTTANIALFTDQAIRQRIPSVIYIGILLVVGVVGNAIVLFIFTKYFKDSSYRVFVRTLAIVDLLYCIIHMPLEVLYLLEPYGFYSAGMCKIYCYFSYCINYMSVILVYMMAIERYIKICKPLSKWHMFSKLPQKAAILAWSIAVCASIPGLFTNGNHVIQLGNDTLIKCGIDDHNNRTFVVIYLSTVGIIYMSMTFFLIFAYSSIVRIICKRRKRLILEQPPVSIVLTRMTRFADSKRDLSIHVHHSNREYHTNLIRTTRTLIILTVIFITVHVPFFSLCMVTALDPSFTDYSNDFHTTMYEIGYRLHMINNVINPFVYGFTDFRFQRAFRLLYGKCRYKR